MNICKNCRFFELYAAQDSSRCTRDQFFTINPVSGDDVRRGEKYCGAERYDFDWIERIFGSKRCGPEGRFFETRESESE